MKTNSCLNGSFKDLTEVTSKLLQRKSARRIAREILKIQSCAAAMQSTYAGALERQSVLLTENVELKRVNKELQEQLSLTGKVEHHYWACWVKREDGSLDGPYSPQVWDSDRKLVRMHLSRRGSTSFEFVCERSQKVSVVPLRFMLKHQVVSQEEISFSATLS